jgi:hypothetical protein
VHVEKCEHDNSTNSAEDQYPHHAVLNDPLSRARTRHDGRLFGSDDFLGCGHFVEITQKDGVELPSTRGPHTSSELAK